MRQKTYKYIAETGNYITISEQAEKHTNSVTLWNRLNDFVEGEITDKFPYITGAKLVAAGWKKIVIHIYYKGPNDEQSRQYQLVVLPSLIDDFRLKIIGPNRHDNKIIIREFTLAWLNNMTEGN